MARITVAFMRELEQQLCREEITYSRMVELLNEKAKEKTSKKTTHTGGTSMVDPVGVM
jgi:hypothetical protein